jgi:hypothetical protein
MKVFFLLILLIGVVSNEREDVEMHVSMHDLENYIIRIDLYNHSDKECYLLTRMFKEDNSLYDSDNEKITMYQPILLHSTYKGKGSCYSLNIGEDENVIDNDMNLGKWYKIMPKDSLTLYTYIFNMWCYDDIEIGCEYSFVQVYFNDWFIHPDSTVTPYSKRIESNPIKFTFHGFGEKYDYK